MTRELWSSIDELGYQMGNMHGEWEKPLEEKIAEDVIWEQTTPLKGWAKTKAFIERIKHGK